MRTKKWVHLCFPSSHHSCSSVPKSISHHLPCCLVLLLPKLFQLSWTKKPAWGKQWWIWCKTKEQCIHTYTHTLTHIHFLFFFFFFFKYTCIYTYSWIRIYQVQNLCCSWYLSLVHQSWSIILFYFSVTPKPFQRTDRFVWVYACMNAYKYEVLIL